MDYRSPIHHWFGILFMYKSLTNVVRIKFMYSWAYMYNVHIKICMCIHTCVKTILHINWYMYMTCTCIYQVLICTEEKISVNADSVSSFNVTSEVKRYTFKGHATCEA